MDDKSYPFFHCHFDSISQRAEFDLDALTVFENGIGDIFQTVDYPRIFHGDLARQSPSGKFGISADLKLCRRLLSFFPADPISNRSSARNCRRFHQWTVVIPAMGVKNPREIPKGKHADLVSTREQLMEVLASTKQKLISARSAQWTAATTGFDADTVIHLGEGVAPISPAQLSSSIKQFESEESRIRHLLERLDVQLAQLMPQVSRLTR